MKEDYYVLCAYKFDKWFKCDMTYYNQKIEFAKKKEDYPCLDHYYEAQFACADDTFEFMLELAYYRKMNNMNYEKFENDELYTFATYYDTPEPHSRIKYTY